MAENINFVPKKTFEKVIAKCRKLGNIGRVGGAHHNKELFVTGKGQVVERKSWQERWEGQLCAGIFLGSCQGMTRLGVERKGDFFRKKVSQGVDNVKEVG